MTRPEQTVYIRPIDPPGLGVRAMLGAEPSKPSGEAGWAVVHRPRNIGFTEYQGYAPLVQTLPLLFDGLDPSSHGDDLNAYQREWESVQFQFDRLWNMARQRVGPRQEPPVVVVDGAGVFYTGTRWVISSVDPGDLLRNERGELVRAFVTVTLTEYIAADLVVTARQSPAAAAVDIYTRTADKTMAAIIAAGGAAAGGGRVYVVRQGDTLSKIAARELGNFRRWKDIADLNGLRDPNRIRVGQRLRLP